MAISVKIALELHFTPPDASRFVPMDFRQADRTVLELDSSHALAFAPLGATVPPAEPRDLPNRGTGGNRLNVSDTAQDPEVHGGTVSESAREVKPPRDYIIRG